RRSLALRDVAPVLQWCPRVTHVTVVRAPLRLPSWLSELKSAVPSMSSRRAKPPDIRPCPGERAAGVTRCVRTATGDHPFGAGDVPRAQSGRDPHTPRHLPTVTPRPAWTGRLRVARTRCAFRRTPVRRGRQRP